MKKDYIDVDGKWGILLIYDYDDRDSDEMSAIMESFEMKERDINKSLRILSTYNSGMAVSSLGTKMTAVFISEATSDSEWWSTLAHELKHASDAILDYYGEELYGEPAAYTTGYLMRKAVEILCAPC